MADSVRKGSSRSTADEPRPERDRVRLRARHDPQMVRAGVWLNLAGVVLITLAATTLLPVVRG